MRTTDANLGSSNSSRTGPKRSTPPRGASDYRSCKVQIVRDQGARIVLPHFFSPYFFDFAGWWPNSPPAAVVIFGPSYLGHVSKVPTFTGMRPLGVAILETFVVFGPLHLRHVSKVPTLTGMKPLKVAILETVVVIGSSYLGNDFQASLS